MSKRIKFEFEKGNSYDYLTNLTLITIGTCCYFTRKVKKYKISNKRILINLANKYFGNNAVGQHTSSVELRCHIIHTYLLN